MHQFRAIALLALVPSGVYLGQPVAAEFFPIDFSSAFNRRLQDNIWSSIGMPNGLLDPSGTTALEGVPFQIPVAGNNYWHSYQPPLSANAGNPLEDNRPRTLSITTNVFNATQVYTLINTYWGETGPNSYAQLEFFGTEDAYALLPLVGGRHIRDFNINVWENQSSNSLNVLQWSGWLGVSTQRLDRQRIELPDSFLGQTLTEIRLTDNGGFNRFDTPTSNNVEQRVFLAGVTVSTSLPGDYNENGTVDAADYTVWRDHMVSGEPLPNDDSPGIGPDDYARWKAHFGEPGGSGAFTRGDGESRAVPEPSSIILFGSNVIGLLALFNKKRGG